MIGRRVWLGRDVQSLSENAEGIELEGRTRLRPGEAVDVMKSGSAGVALMRRAIVWTWTVAELGSEGPTFRGYCYWT